MLNFDFQLAAMALLVGAAQALPRGPLVHQPLGPLPSAAVNITSLAHPGSFLASRAETLTAVETPTPQPWFAPCSPGTNHWPDICQTLSTQVHQFVQSGAADVSTTTTGSDSGIVLVPVATATPESGKMPGHIPFPIGQWYSSVHLPTEAQKRDVAATTTDAASTSITSEAQISSLLESLPWGLNPIDLPLTMIGNNIPPTQSITKAADSVVFDTPVMTVAPRAVPKDGLWEQPIDLHLADPDAKLSSLSQWLSSQPVWGLDPNDLPSTTADSSASATTEGFFKTQAPLARAEDRLPIVWPESPLDLEHMPDASRPAVNETAAASPTISTVTDLDTYVYSLPSSPLISLAI